MRAPFCAVAFGFLLGTCSLLIIGCNPDDPSTHPKSAAPEDQPVIEDVPDPTP